MGDRSWWRHRVGVATVGLALSSSAAAAGSVTSERVSRGDPYAGCPVGGTGTVVAGAEVEPHLAIDPTNPRVMIAAWQQDRLTSGAAQGLVAGVSSDGGRHFAEVPLPFTACAPGGAPYQRASDPWVTIGPDGTAYAVGLAADGTRSVMLAAASDDGGRHWRDVSAIANDPRSGFVNDKGAVTADPRHRATAYMVWDRSDRSRPGSPPTLFSKTVDGGRHWTAPRIIVDPGQRAGTFGNVIVVDPAGTLYDFFDDAADGGPATAGAHISMVRSTDAGATWSRPQQVADDRAVGVVDPATGTALRTGAGVPEPAVDRRTGELYVVWQDARFSGGRYDEVAITTSTDHGLTWSTPRRVSPPTGRASFTPSLAVDARGAVAVGFYRLEAPSPRRSTLPTGYVVITSPRGAAQFGEAHALGSPFDMLRAPLVERTTTSSAGRFVGDYQGLAPAGEGGFRALFVATNGEDDPDPTDVFTATVEEER
jgi:hypothetical protein